MTTRWVHLTLTNVDVDVVGELLLDEPLATLVAASDEAVADVDDEEDDNDELAFVLASACDEVKLLLLLL